VEDARDDHNIAAQDLANNVAISAESNPQLAGVGSGAQRTKSWERPKTDDACGDRLGGAFSRVWVLLSEPGS
jgi:hypothetical protein